MTRGRPAKPPTPYPLGHPFSERAKVGYNQMLWYAWGRLDAPGSTDVAASGAVDEGFRLASLWSHAVEDYHLEVVGYLPNLPDFFVAHLQRAEVTQPAKET